jgi:hypothetical protein
MATPRNVLLVAATTGYQVEQFRQAASRMDVELTLASDCCHQLENPWGDHAVPVRFDDAKGALAAVRARGPFQGIIACGDRAAVLAAELADRLNLRFHSPRAAARCHDKFAFRQTMESAGLPVPWFRRERLTLDPPQVEKLAAEVACPCVLKPLMLSASRGVIRVNNAAEFVAAYGRIRRLLESQELRALRDPNAEWLMIEGYIAGREYALEGWIAMGVLQRFALFDKPDPLEGPYFEESLYIAPSRLDWDRRALIWDMVEAAARAVGLGPGPIHAEIRMAGEAASPVYVLEVAARPIGGLCARTLRFESRGERIGLEELLLRGALGENLAFWEREKSAAGVMMIPIPQSGILAEVEGVNEAAAVADIEAVEITAKPGEPLQALPEGASYLGFLFARARTPEQVEAALRAAHSRLRIHWRETLSVVG